MHFSLAQPSRHRLAQCFFDFDYQRIGEADLPLSVSILTYLVKIQVAG
jgi:hypothetical protein